MAGKENGNGNGSTVPPPGGNPPGGVPGCPPGYHAENINGIWFCVIDPVTPPPPGTSPDCPPGSIATFLPGTGWVCTPEAGPLPTPPPTITPPGGGVSPPTIPGLDALIAWLRQVFDARDEILRKLADEVARQAKETSDAAGTIKDAIVGNLSKYLGPIADIMAKFQATVGNLVQGLVPTTLSLVGAALGGVETIAAAFLNNAASIDDIIGAVAGALGVNKEFIGSFLAAALGAGFESGLRGFIEANPNGELTSVERALSATGVSAEEWRNPVNLMKKMQANLNEGDTVSKLMIWASVVWGMWSAFAAPVVSLSEQIAMGAAQVTPLAADEAAAASVRGLIDKTTARQWAVRGGISDKVFDTKEQLAQQIPPIELITAAFFRGNIPEELYDYYLGRLGFGKETTDIVKQAMVNIPNVSDVLRFLVRDVFIPEFVEAFGMDKEYPPDADIWAKKLGIPHEVMMLHWRAHWDLPSVSQGYEMFQRAKIDEVALRRLLRAQGVEPFWRDPLIAIAYNPLTRVDLRRMDKIGTITDAQLMRGYLDIGYSPEQAKLLFDFTKAYNKADKPKTLVDLTDGLKARVISAVLNATIKEAEGTKLLAEIGYKQAEITAFITEARLLRQEAISRKVSDLVGALYVKGHRTEAEARAALQEHGYIADEIALIIREWKLEKELHTPTEAELKQKDLTAGNVITAFVDGAMNQTDALAYLKYLRYDDKEAAVLIAEAKYKIAAQEEKDAIEVVHVGVLSGRVTEDAASAQLSQLNIPTKKRDGLLNKWELERHGKVEKIPLSSLKDLLGRGLWDDDRMTKYLRETGYSSEDIEALLALWGSQAAEKKARDAAAAAKAAAAAAKKAAKK